MDKRKQLQQAYIVSMVDKKQSLKQQFQQLSDGDGNIDDFYSGLHKLAGSAGMYGFTNVSDCARDLMEVIKNVDHFDLTKNPNITKSFADLVNIMTNVE